MRVLKVLGIVLGIFLLSEFVSLLLPDSFFAVQYILPSLPSIAILGYALYKARKGDYLAPKVIFIVIIVDELLKILLRIL